MEIISIAFTGMRLALPIKTYRAQSEIMVMSKRHHTSMVESNVMALPKTPVKPQRKTAALSWRRAFFMEIKDMGGKATSYQL